MWTLIKRGCPCDIPKPSFPYETNIGNLCLENILCTLEFKNSIKEFLWCFVAFLNTITEDLSNSGSGSSLKENLKDLIVTKMNNAKIPFDVYENEDGYFIFPKGAKELDNALISEPLEWLKSYPQSRKDFVKALRQYNDLEYPRDIADNFRKALEMFLQEFFNNNKNLKNNIDSFGNFLKEHGALDEISNEFVKLLNLYDKFNNKASKHNDNISNNLLEYIMYSTFNFARLLMTLDKRIKTENK